MQTHNPHTTPTQHLHHDYIDTNTVHAWTEREREREMNRWKEREEGRVEKDIVTLILVINPSCIGIDPDREFENKDNIYVREFKNETKKNSLQYQWCHLDVAALTKSGRDGSH